MSKNPDWRRFLLDASGDVRRLSYVDRFSSVPVAVRENVAEHSFWVVLYAAMIHREVDGPPDAVPGLLAYAAMHDLPECLTGDVVRTFKYSSPEIKEAVEAAECKLLERLEPGLRDLYKEVVAVADGSPIGWYIKEVVKAADFVSLYQYMWREKRKGNREIDQFFSRMQTDMRESSESAQKRSTGLSDEPDRRRRGAITAQIGLLYECMADDKFVQRFMTS